MKDRGPDFWDIQTLWRYSNSNTINGKKKTVYIAKCKLFDHGRNFRVPA